MSCKLNSPRISYPNIRLGGLLVFGLAVLVGCAEPTVRPSTQHLVAPPRAPAGSVPELALIPSLPPPANTPRPETYTVVVNQVSVRELLFALARDAKMDIDIGSDIEGMVTLNALNQTLPQLLDRLARQVDLRWEMRGKTLLVSRDTPFLRNYQVDYVNLIRNSNSSVNIATQVAATSPIGTTTGNNGGLTSNNSLFHVTSKSNHDLWDSLMANLRDLLRETDRVLPEGSFEQTTENEGTQTSTGTGGFPAAAARNNGRRGNGSAPASMNPSQTHHENSATIRRSTFREAASVIANRETGLIAVRATAKQHDKIREFLDRVRNSAHRQVLIEATIVEIELNDQTQSGVDWNSFALASGFKFSQNLMGSNLASGLLDSATRSRLADVVMAQATAATPTLSPLEALAQIQQINAAANPATPYLGGSLLSGANKGMTVGFGKGSSFIAAMKLLSQYGRTKVISSPKISALNNQPAILRVVDNLVYFSVSGSTSQSATSTIANYTTTTNTVAVGFVLQVTPQIDDQQTVTLTVRPTISRLRGYARDPNPALGNISNLVPVVQTREMESVMRVPSGNTIMMGGLMEDQENKDSEGIPTLGDLPGVGRLFSTRNSQSSSKELVIFLRPVVITDPSLNGDYRFALNQLPGERFFNQPIERPLDGTTRPERVAP